MTDEQDGSIDLTDHGLEVLAVAAGQAPQWIRRSDDREVFAEKLVVQTAKTGRVSERAVDQDNGGISHRKLPLSDRVSVTRICEAGLKSAGGPLSAYANPRRLQGVA